MPRKKKELLDKITAATTGIKDAEDDLEKLLRALVREPRAEKMKISEVVEGAFAKLKSARACLTDLEVTLTADATTLAREEAIDEV